MIKKIVSCFVAFLFCFTLLKTNVSEASVTGYTGSGSQFDAYAHAHGWYATPCTPVFKCTMQEYLKEYADACWFCDVFDKLVTAVNALSKEVFNKLSKDFLGLMGVGILFLILFKVGKILVSLQEVDLMQFLNDLFKPLGRAIIASALLGVSLGAGQQTVFYLITEPIADVSVLLGEKILSTTLGSVKLIDTKGVVSQQEQLENNLKQTSGSNSAKLLSEANTALEAENSNPTDKPLGDGFSKMLKAWMSSISSSFVVGIALGGSFVKYACDDFFDQIPMFLSGIIIWLAFWMIYLMFPLKIVNAFVRLAFILTLMPLWIVLWVFPATAGYTKKAWEMFISSCLLLVIISVMVALAVMLMNNIVPTKDMDGFWQALMTGKDNQALVYVKFGSGFIMNAIAFSAMSFMLLGAAEPLANTFASAGGDIGVGNGMAGLAARGAGVAWAGTKLAAKAGTALGGAIIRKAGSKGSSGDVGGSSGWTNTSDSKSSSHMGHFNEGTQTSSGETDSGRDFSGDSASTDSNSGEVTSRENTYGDRNSQGSTSSKIENSSNLTDSTPSDSNFGSMGAISSGRKNALEEAVKHRASSDSCLKNLVEDCSFIEGKLSLSRDSFNDEMRKHSWKGNSGRMRDLASKLYQYGDKSEDIGNQKQGAYFAKDHLRGIFSQDGEMSVSDEFLEEIVPKPSDKPVQVSKNLAAFMSQVSAYKKR